jgi:hypothetical protein
MAVLPSPALQNNSENEPGLEDNIPLFPEQTASYILQFQFSAWYPKFSSLSIKSTIIRPLDQNFKEYLESDGVFVPEGSEDLLVCFPCGSLVPILNIHSIASPAESSLSDTEDEDEGKEEESEEEDNSPPFSFPGLDAEIRRCIQQYDGGVFPKLNFSSPRVSQSYVSPPPLR